MVNLFSGPLKSFIWGRNFIFLDFKEGLELNISLWSNPFPAATILEKGVQMVFYGFSGTKYWAHKKILKTLFVANYLLYNCASVTYGRRTKNGRVINENRWQFWSKLCFNRCKFYIVKNALCKYNGRIKQKFEILFGHSLYSTS